MKKEDEHRLERAVVIECVDFVLRSDAIDDWEFSTRIGVDRSALGDVLRRLQTASDLVSDDRDRIWIGNCLNEVCHGLAVSDAAWTEWFTISREDVYETLAHVHRDLEAIPSPDGA